MTNPDQLFPENPDDLTPWHPLMGFGWDAVKVAGDHLLGIADLKRPMRGDVESEQAPLPGAGLPDSPG